MPEIPKSNVTRWILCIASLSPLLFTISVLGFFPLAGRKFMYDICFPLSLIGLFLLWFERRLTAKDFRSFFDYLFPFLPFLLTYLVVFLIHRENFSSAIRISTIVNMTLQCSVVYFFINKSKILNYQYLYLSCIAAVALYALEVVFTAFSTSNSIFELKHILPFYPAIQSECLSLLGGILLLSFVSCKGPKLTRYLLLASATLAFVIAICCIQVRASLVVPFIIVFCIACIGDKQAFIRSGKGLILFFIILFATCSISTIPSRIEMGFNEVSESLETPTMKGLSDLTNETKELSDDKNNQHKFEVYGSSWGARVAIWKTAAVIIKSNLLTGTGLGRPEDHREIQKIFQKTGVVLPHFHNDSIQTLVVGGVLLFIGYLSTLLWLLFRAIKLHSAQLLTLLLSFCWYGLIDISYFNILPFLFFMTAWAVLYYLRQNEGNGK